ncbi:MAG TPA: hypothetical protein VMZ92_14635 [Planctomycetota bacterium]|nr:hypothetical protein [Planctomycetota bacterium]
MVLRPKHFRAMELLVGTDLLQRDVARRVRVTPRTLGRWLRDAAFQTELARRRDAMPCRLDGLRMQTARTLLLNVIRRIDTGDEKVPLKEITQLLAQLLSETGIAAAPTDAPRREDDDQFTLTPDQADRMWDILEEAESGAAQADAPQPVHAAS